ncbi:hypothetical protein ACIGDI_11150 [Streptomyces sp. NPDC085900]|uniref:hypothetical protein n=1 Tax=Streptomyces sp. NPDC085900 TaxID=3365737 RepID=UPI0037D08824
MSVQDDLTSVQRCLDDLSRSVGRLEQQLGSGGLDIRRVRADADHLRESVALLRASATLQASSRKPELVTIPDQPYDDTQWTDCDDEGLGAHHGPEHRR